MSDIDLTKPDLVPEWVKTVQARQGELASSVCSLLPCPFCGGEPEEFGFPGDMWVRCKLCKVLMPDDGPLDHIAAWNRRAENSNSADPPLAE